MCKDFSGNRKDTSKAIEYLWGIDGKGRAHICKADDMIIIFCMISGVGVEGVWILEDQENAEKMQSI